ncbi:MAG: metalloregulator ArsR/SmtB family transcription factor [Bacilli bacterium]|nr:metalloregulator ArsR/SmtB family transcription factor [Bacilli bacterium]
MNNFIEQEYIHESTVRLVKEKMINDEKICDLSDFFKIFADSTRVKILFALSKSEMCVYDLSKVIGSSQSAVSHQLRILRNTKLVKTTRKGKEIFYSLSDDHILTIINQGLEHVEE